MVLIPFRLAVPLRKLALGVVVVALATAGAFTSSGGPATESPGGSEVGQAEATTTPLPSPTVAPTPTPTAVPVPTRRPVPTPTVTSSPTPAAPSPTPRATRPPFQTPTPGPWIPPTPVGDRGFPPLLPALDLTPRQLYEATNVDGGALLLPYIEASGAHSDFEMDWTIEQSTSIGDSSIFDLDGETSVRIVMVVHNSGDSSFIRFTEVDVDSPEAATESEEHRIAVFQTMELVGNEGVVYGRAAGFEKWVDITLLTTGQPSVTDRIIPLQAGQPDSNLAELLFAMASGDFDPRNIDEIEEITGTSPLINFMRINSLPDRLAFVHEQTETIDTEFISSTTHTRLGFRVNAKSGLIDHTVRRSDSTVGGAFQFMSSELEQFDITYRPQIVVVPSPGDPDIETDPAKIAAFREFFN